MLSLSNESPLYCRSIIRNALSSLQGKYVGEVNPEATIDTSTIVGLRDRALMTFTFARVGPPPARCTSQTFYVQGRTWVRLHEKGGKRHEMPCHHKLEADLHNYIEALHAARRRLKAHPSTRRRGCFP